ncbi:sulfatase-like hydrolase/transferase [Catalinimonas niigatensis]|uniref:sulfatase-like hydrolase/transferase n=1 Tax=Catalinimonas niigatensis TaxID=1397264 RepID=UPI002664F11A|nr:sulfatase-like hydrolase/transferase [Catalinimonas niigatensis]WPP51795.1 sulfatase-like hydrolase/transferase [Catalinimonas niigatensis]
MNYLYLLCIGSLFLIACKSQSQTEVSKPNVVLIMADDLGYGGISCYGEPNIQTPHLDSLAAQGIKFTDFHANAPVCTPTRAALLTGNYQQRTGLEGVIYVRGETREVGLDTTQLTIAELMKENGYATGMMGKWHLGYKKEFNPVQHGFDEFYGYVSGNVDYHSHYDNAGIYDWWHNLDSIQEEGYVTDLITEHSVDFINQHKDEPFFLYVPHESPHVPFQGRNDPAYRFPGEEFTYYGPVEGQHRAYKEMVEVMDEGIGKIMDALKVNQLEENTLVIFISDNGGEAFGNNGVLNGQKGQLLEGGHRVPAIAYWKNNIHPEESSETLMTMDLLPTILSIAHAQISKDIEFDGQDFSPVLFEGSEMPDRTLFWRYNGQKAARKNQWKLLITESDTSLYNLDQDLKETRDLSAQHQDIMDDLLREVVDWEKEIGKNGEMKTL